MSWPNNGSFWPNGTLDRNFKTSCQLLAAIRPITMAIMQMIIMPSFPIIRLFRLKDWLVPIRASGIATIHGIFERMAKKRLVRRNAAARSPAEKPTITLAMSDLIKISVNPTSWYHHQSVIKETMLEKKIKVTNARPKNVKEKNFRIFIQKNQPILSWPVIIDDGSLL